MDKNNVFPSHSSRLLALVYILFLKFHGGMGKVLEPWVSQQKLLGNKLVTKLAELFGTILGNLEPYEYFMGECLFWLFFFSN